LGQPTFQVPTNLTWTSGAVSPPSIPSPPGQSVFARPQQLQRGGRRPDVRVAGPAPAKSGATDYPYSGAKFRRALHLSKTQCANCYDPNPGHVAKQCTMRCDRYECRKPNGDAADHARNRCPRAT